MPPRHIDEIYVDVQYIFIFGGSEFTFFYAFVRGFFRFFDVIDDSIRAFSEQKSMFGSVEKGMIWYDDVRDLDLDCGGLRYVSEEVSIDVKCMLRLVFP